MVVRLNGALCPQDCCGIIYIHEMCFYIYIYTRTHIYTIYVRILWPHRRLNSNRDFRKKPLRLIGATFSRTRYFTL